MKTTDKEAARQKNYDEALATVQKHFHPGEKLLHTERVLNANKNAHDITAAIMMAIPFLAVIALLAVFAGSINEAGGKAVLIAVILLIATLYAYLFLYPFIRKTKEVSMLLFTDFAVYLISADVRSPIEFLYYKDIDKRLKIAAYSIRFIFEPRDESESKQLAKRYSELLKEIKSGKHTDELPMTQMRHMAVIQRTSHGTKIQVLYMIRAFAIENGERLAKKVFEIEKAAHAAGRGFPIVSPPDNMILPD